MNENQIRDITRQVVSQLVNRDFDLLYEHDQKKLISADELKLAIDDYPGVITMPPGDGFEKVEIYWISSEEAGIDFDLWFDNEISDLTLSMNIKMISGTLVYSVDGIHLL